jgi:hypothetical protein
MRILLPLAHLRHWYDLAGFLLPMAGVIMWLRFQEWRRRKNVVFAEFVTMAVRDGQWEIVDTKADITAVPRLRPQETAPWASPPR